MDRALTNAVFNLDRDSGIQSWNKFGEIQPVWFKLALTSGEGRNQRNPNTGLATTARVEWLPLGEFKNEGDYSEGDLEFEPASKLSFGLVYNLNRQTSRVGGQTGAIFDSGATRNMETWIADALWKLQGWAISSEAFLRRARDPIVNANQKIFVGRGLNLQASYVFPSMWSPALRWTRVSPESWLETQLDDRTQWTLGLSRYIRKHKIKVQGDITLEDVKSRGTRPRLENYSYRLQLEFGF
ncbi:MAG: hypothetical protein ACK5Y2_09270 [Bdellovibrionales bacterium]